MLLSTPTLCLSSKTTFFFNSHSQSLMKSFASKTSSSLGLDAHEITDVDAAISLQEWQGWGTTSPVPSMVNQVIRDLRLLEKDIEPPMEFCGNHGTLSGGFKVEEDKKHRAKYATLSNSEEKIQFFSARQIACRLLGSRGYLCQKCWLPLGDCICSRVTMCSLWHGLRIWLYMHPKDFLRQNNTGKLLWQVFGVQAAKLCLYGITEHEELMWNELKRAGRNKVWCLYPDKNAMTESVKDIVGCSMNPECQVANEDTTMHIILFDGTWSNSGAMFKRLQVCQQTVCYPKFSAFSPNSRLCYFHKDQR
ncbi:hypothetical protein ACS0TY_017443 [Phlomoides rotata]